jgi:4-amino-4-deoxy-L-arabinose transferase-like glycosyltransferase
MGGTASVAASGWAAAGELSLGSRAMRWAIRHYAACVALISLLAAVNCFWRLSSNVLSDLDEARYGVAASEMLRTHSGLVATYGGQPELWNLKPPLGYWLQEASFRVFGPTLFALRFPAAICTLVVVALTMSFCRRWYGSRAALLTGLLLTTCFGLVSHHGSRSGDLDSVLTLIMLTAMMQVPQLATSGVARLLCAGAFAFGFLLKSFAILPFMLVAAVYLLSSGDWRRMPRRIWLMPALLFFSIVVAWMALRCWTDGSIYFVQRMFAEDLLQRSTQTIDQETYKPWGYLAVLLDRFAPWPLFILASLSLRRPKPSEKIDRHAASHLVWLWALVPLVAFSMARTQHHWYLDPSYPAWSILAAVAVWRLLRCVSDNRRWMVGTLVILGLLFCESRVLFRIFRTDHLPASQAFLLSLRRPDHLPLDRCLVAAFSLSHSERFILEVIDGYRVSDPDLSSNAACSEQALLLSRRWRTPTALMLRPDVKLVSAGAGYYLFDHVEKSARVDASP